MQMSVMPNLPKLTTELERAGISVPGLLTEGDPPAVEVRTVNDQGQVVDLPPEAQAVLDAHDPTPLDKIAETTEDIERLAIINERAQTDPAYAALVEMTLGKTGG